MGNESDSVEKSPLFENQLIVVQLGWGHGKYVVVCLGESSKYLKIINPTSGYSQCSIRKERFVEALPFAAPSIRKPFIHQFLQEMQQKYDQQQLTEDTQQLWADLVEIFEYSPRKGGDPSDLSPQDFQKVSKFIGELWDGLPVTKEQYQQLLNLFKPVLSHFPEISLMSGLSFWFAFERNKSISAQDVDSILWHEFYSSLVALRDLFIEKGVLISFKDSQIRKLRSSPLISKVPELAVCKLLAETLTFIHPYHAHLEEFSLLSAQLAQVMNNISEYEDLQALEAAMLEIRNQFEEKYFKAYQKSHKAYYEKLEGIGAKLQELERNLGLLKDQTSDWLFSPSFDAKCVRVLQLIGKLKSELQEIPRVHEMQFQVCSCGYSLDQNALNEENFLKTIHDAFTYVQQLFKKYQVSKGELIKEPLLFVLLALKEVDGLVGRTGLKLILKGSKSKKITGHDLQKKNSYGTLSQFTLPQIQAFINEALSEGYAYIEYRGRHDLPFLRISPVGDALISHLTPELFRSHIIATGTVRQVVFLLEGAPSSLKEELLELFLQAKRFDVLEALGMRLRGKHLEPFVCVISRDPELEFAPLLLSIFLERGNTTRLRRLALQGLGAIDRKYPASQTKSLLAGVLSFEKGVLKKELQQLLSA